MRNNENRIGAAPEIQDSSPIEQLASNNQQIPINFIVPTEFVPLPSKGKFYNKSHPLFNKDVVEIKQMTAKEEDILTSKNLLKKGIALDRLLQSLIVDKNINTDTLTLEDRTAILIAARISGYGPDYATSVVCPNCNEKSKFTFNLYEKLDKKEVEEKLEGVVFNEDGTFDVLLPATKWVTKCRVLNGYDEKILLRLTEQKKNSSSGDSLLLDQLKLTIVTINNATDKQVLEHAISAMPAKDSKYLRNVYQKIIKGIDMIHVFECKHCSASMDMEVPITADFFWFK